MILWHISRNVGQCQPLDTEEECLCCREIDVMASRLDEGFQPFILDGQIKRSVSRNTRGFSQLCSMLMCPTPSTITTDSSMDH